MRWTEAVKPLRYVFAKMGCALFYFRKKLVVTIATALVGDG